jgi:predicted O-linked N-acetylglucosamine transferase (SPINDLY family)
MNLFNHFLLLASRQSRRLNDQGLHCWEQGDLPRAAEVFRSALKKNPGNAAATSNLGALLIALHQYEEGMALLQRAVDMNGTDAGILVNLGNAYHLGGLAEAAIAHYRRALACDPDNLQARLNVLRPLLEICDWQGVLEHQSFVRESFQKKGFTSYDYISPFNSLFLPFDRVELLVIAKRYAEVNLKTQSVFERQPANPARRIKVAYLSSDFHDHPTAHLTLGLYGLHDRTRFEIYAYSIGREDLGPYRAKIMSDCDWFRDVHLASDQAIADEIRRDGIDVLVDLKGYTGGGRPGILALRPAPVQVNYLGYPGTMGADCVDFLIADPIIVPTGHDSTFSEKIIRLPHSYQPTDHRQEIGGWPGDRRLAGLPEEGFVFCCFNNSAKIDRATFGAWMEILAAVSGSVLWLLDTPALARNNLAKAAAKAGVAPERILYAPILSKAAHLGRLRLADLMLDTFIYNAHTTATDALWAGLPLVTKTGEAFASRVATSLLHAVGLPQLAVTTEGEYVRLAVQLAHDPAHLASLRLALAGRAATPLFDTPGYVRALEDAYVDMVAQGGRG